MSLIDRFLTSFRGEDTGAGEKPGLIQNDDGTVDLVNPDGSRSRVGNGGSVPSGAGSPTGSVVPTGTGQLYVDETNGGLYIALGLANTDWILVGGYGYTPGWAAYIDAYNGFESFPVSGITQAASDPSGALGTANLTDVAALANTGNNFGWFIPAGNVDGTQYFAGQVGDAGQFTHMWAADGSYAFPGALTGPTWGVAPDGAEYKMAISAPADGDVATGQRLDWYDDTTGKPVTRFKEKDAAGTLTSGVSLSSSGHQTTVGAAGGASALPATPTEYIKVRDDAGNLFVIPAYAAS